MECIRLFKEHDVQYTSGSIRPTPSTTQTTCKGLKFSLEYDLDSLYDTWALPGETTAFSRDDSCGKDESRVYLKALVHVICLCIYAKSVCEELCLSCQMEVMKA